MIQSIKRPISNHLLEFPTSSLVSLHRSIRFYLLKVERCRLSFVRETFGRLDVISFDKDSVTSMHSSRVRTARLLPVSPSMHCTGGCLLLGGLLRGGVCSWGCLLLGGSAPSGVSALGGVVCSWGVCFGGYPSMQWGRSPREQNS